MGKWGWLIAGLIVLAVLPALLSPGSIVGDGVDAYGTHWFYWWVRHCLETGQSPTHTNFFYYPSSTDFFVQTGLNLVDALLSVPFQWLLGPTAYQPFFVAVLLAGNAASMWILSREVLQKPADAQVATLFWTFNPYSILELSEGRPTQAFLWFIPLSFWALLVSARTLRPTMGLLLGLFVALTGWSYWYNGYFLVFLLIPVAMGILRGTGRRGAVLAVWALGLLTCLLLIGPAVWGMRNAASAGAVPGLVTTGSVWSLPPGLGEAGAQEFRSLANGEMRGVPLLLQPAWPLLLLVAVWARPRRWAWLVALGLGLVVALGPALGAADHPIPWPPYLLLYHLLPFFNRLWHPYRMLGVAFVPLALLIGQALGDRKRWVAAFLVLNLLGETALGTFPLQTVRAACPPMLKELPDSAVIFMPFKSQNASLMWQTEFELPTFGGMGEVAPLLWPPAMRDRVENGFVRSLRGAAMVPTQPVPFFPPQRQAILDLGFRWLVLHINLLDAETIRLQKVTPIDALTVRRSAVARYSVLAGAEPAGLNEGLVLWDLQGHWQSSFPYSEAALAEIPVEGRPGSRIDQALRRLGRTTTLSGAEGTSQFPNLGNHTRQPAPPPRP